MLGKDKMYEGKKCAITFVIDIHIICVYYHYKMKKK